ncbi:hypothetical protein BC629DRAFT_1438265 [Irpex lacteus]|nr:hypothetical protein BC629DRAFT_1438265 [Irpex lacteus]
MARRSSDPSLINYRTPTPGSPQNSFLILDRTRSLGQLEMPTREGLLSIVLCVTSITLVLTTTCMFMDAYYDYFAIIKANVQDTKTNLTNIFSFVGEDFPFLLPLNSLPSQYQNRSLVRATFEETVHYGFDTEVSLNEWYQMLPLGSIGVRQGPYNRLFAVGMFHELHCHRLLHEAFVRRDKHMLHHLYLCRGDLTLEPGHLLSRNFTEERHGPTRICRDWEAVYDNMGYSWLRWLEINPGSKHSEIAVTRKGVSED